MARAAGRGDPSFDGPPLDTLDHPNSVCRRRRLFDAMVHRGGDMALSSPALVCRR